MSSLVLKENYLQVFHNSTICRCQKKKEMNYGGIVIQDTEPH